MIAIVRRLWRRWFRRRPLLLPPARVVRGRAGKRSTSGPAVIVDCECPAWPSIHVHVFDGRSRGVYAPVSVQQQRSFFLLTEQARIARRVRGVRPLESGPPSLPVAGPGISTKR